MIFFFISEIAMFMKHFNNVNLHFFFIRNSCYLYYLLIITVHTLICDTNYQLNARADDY